MELRLLYELLKKTLKELHSLRKYEGDDEDRYELILRTTMELVVQLLNYPMKNSAFLELRASSGAIEPFELIYCYRDSNKLKINILDYIDTYKEPEDSEGGVLDQITKMLADHLHDHRAIRIKSDYELIVTKVCQLIEYLILYHKQAESTFQDYISKCISYEYAYYLNLHDKLHLDLQDQDTEQIVDFLDSVVKIDDTTDSIFSVLPTPGDVQLGLICNNDDFNSIYNLFLQIILSKNLTDFHKYSRVMIDVFKKHAMVEYFELDQTNYQNQLHRKFTEVFVNGENPILQAKYDTINRKIILNLLSGNETTQKLPAKDIINESAQNESILDLYLTYEPDILPKLANEGKHPCSREDQIKLFHTLLHIIPLLNEFNLNFNPKFPYILRYFLKLIYQTLPSLSTPEDLIYVNQLLTDVNLIVDFENEEDSNQTDIKATVENFHKLHLKLVDSKNQKSTLLMRYAYLQFDSNYFLKLFVMNRWKSKEAKNMTLINKLNDWNDEKELKEKQNSLRKWFSLRQKFYNIEIETKNFYRLRLLYKVMIQQWRERLFLLNDLEVLLKKLQVSKFWNIWVDKYKTLQQMKQNSIDFDSQKLLKQIFNQLTGKYTEKLSLELASIEFNRTRITKHDKLILEYYMNKWYRLMNSQMNCGSRSPSDETLISISWGDKVSTLNMRENEFVLRKFIHAWLKSVHLAKQYHKSQMLSQKYLLSYVLNNMWIKKFNMIVTAKNHVVLRDKDMSTKIFSLWRKYAEQKRIAKEFHNQNVLKNVMKYWKLRIRELLVFKKSNFLNLTDDKLLIAYWSKLRNSVKSVSHLKRKDLEIAKSKLTLWLSRHRKVRVLNVSADSFNRSNVGRDFYYKWMEKLIMAEEMVHVADLNVQRKYFNQFIKIIYEHKKLDNKLEKLRINRNFCDKLLLKLTFEKWKSRFEMEFEISANVKIQRLEHFFINPNINAIYFRLWVDNFNKCQSKTQALIEESKLFSQQGTVVKMMMNKWKHKYSLLQERNNEAENFKSILLEKKFMMIWYNQCFGKLSHLNEISESYIARKEISILEDIIHNWSRKVLNTLKRNQESCDQFIGRWQNLKLKGIFGIWMLKYRERIELDDDFLGDLSNISSLSPLSQRRLKQEKNELTANNKSYLYTPIKEQVSKVTINTPRSTRGSPTKLQETTQRLKSERIKALRQYLSRAKARATSTPEKRQTWSLRSELNVNLSKSQFLIDNSSTRLSPNNASKYVGIVPPAPPNFDVGRNISFSLSEQSRSILNDSETEKATIESAKKLRRIKPIKFPTEEDLNLPKFSPVGKLKDQLRKNLTNGIGIEDNI